MPLEWTRRIRRSPRALAALVLLLVPVGVASTRLGAPKPLDAAALAALYAEPAPRPSGGLAVFHLGHSLVGRDMPAMLEQLAGHGHTHASQLGWGTSLKEHWEPDLPINGFAVENAHPRYRDAAEALGSGAYDAVVLTEMVEIRDAIRYHESWRYLRSWSERALAGNPRARVYLYETWHRLDDPEGWLARLDRDRARYWEGELLARSQAGDPLASPIRVVPAGQVMARFARALAERGGVEGLSSFEELFARDAEGRLDPIHLNDLGAYLVALTHYAALYQRSPVGLPHRLARADGAPADAPSAEAAALMQEIVWEVVSADPKTGVGRGDAS
ncbi:hypothetical protein [Salinarimonas sp.]|uniref:hypothetical protein n=1 Tax=Salinarimonas sp. TaxID=2766526 RepID=UPI0032D95A16